MIVFLRRVPKDLSLAELLEFLEPALKGGLFRAAGEVVTANLLEMRTLQTLEPEYHAVVHIKPDEAAERVIKKLHGEMLRGRRVALHEYVVRNWRNERRVAKAPPADGAKRDRRSLPTRRRALSLEIIPLE
jgi:hypothetical protein